MALSLGRPLVEALLAALLAIGLAAAGLSALKAQLAADAARSHPITIGPGHPAGVPPAAGELAISRVIADQAGHPRSPLPPRLPAAANPQPKRS